MKPWTLRQWQGIYNGALERGTDLVAYVGGVLGSTAFDGQANVLYDLADVGELDGLAIWSTGIGWNKPRREMADFLERYKAIPRVSLEMAFPGVPSLLLDDYQGMKDVVSHIIEAHGCRRIAFLRGAATHEGSVLRYKAFVDALAEHGLSPDPDLVPATNPDWDGAAMAGSVLERCGADFDALIASSESMLIGALPILESGGMRIPEDLCVAGFDNLPEGTTLTPPLTTADPQFFEMGRRAVELLVDQIEGRPVPELQTLPVRLEIRESCGCPPRVIRDSLERGGARRVPFEPRAARGPGHPAAEPAAGDVLRALGAAGPGADGESLSRIWAAFVAEVKDDERGFLSILDELLTRVAAADGDVGVWLAVLGGLRLLSSDWIDGLSVEARRRADGLWLDGHRLVVDVARRIEIRRGFLIESRRSAVLSISETLIATFDAQALMDIIARELPRLGILGCWISVYVHPETPTGEARLILACDERGQLPLPPDGVFFPSPQLAPAGYRVVDRQSVRLLLALFFRSENIGFVLFDLRGPDDASVCEALRWQLSSALKGSFLVQREKAEASEKATLLKELQHRVMNSMSLISSIVSLESRRAKAPETVETLSKLETRILALASLYKALYHTGVIERVELSDYLARVVDSAAAGMGADARGIEFDREIEPCKIDLKRAVSLGLIVNELVTDSLKYAFPRGAAGRVAIKLERSLGMLRLEVSDDGIGLPADFDIKTSKGFGLNLVALLAKQIGGDLQFAASKGMRTSIVFPA